MILRLKNQRKKFGGIASVSYTHLDVYKRQEPDHYAYCWLNHPACIKKNGAPKSPVEAQNIKEEE